MKKWFTNGNRSFIDVDGCHLKGSYGRTLLPAITVDGNCGLLPIAIAIMELENGDARA